MYLSVNQKRSDDDIQNCVHNIQNLSQICGELFMKIVGKYNLVCTSYQICRNRPFPVLPTIRETMVLRIVDGIRQFSMPKTTTLLTVPSGRERLFRRACIFYRIVNCRFFLFRVI